MCDTVKLPRRSYYDALKWTKSPRQLKAEEFSELVSRISEQHSGEIGSSKIQQILHEQGVSCTQQTVWRHMKKLGLLNTKYGS